MLSVYFIYINTHIYTYVYIYTYTHIYTQIYTHIYLFFFFFLFCGFVRTPGRLCEFVLLCACCFILFHQLLFSFFLISLVTLGDFRKFAPHLCFPQTLNYDVPFSLPSLFTTLLADAVLMHLRGVLWESCHQSRNCIYFLFIINYVKLP